MKFSGAFLHVVTQKEKMTEEQGLEEWHLK